MSQCCHTFKPFIFQLQLSAEIILNLKFKLNYSERYYNEIKHRKRLITDNYLKQHNHFCWSLCFKIT